ncbi:MAG TPA: thioredoxin family protein [Chitinophagaceae bacterium]|jgi:thioredoxin-related protein|nr:thioredoxin family protein [Chitinophagaceae bacterium]
MKRILTALLACGLFAFVPVAQLPIGASLPKADVKLKDISGKEITLQEARKKNGLLVMFSCNTCPYVVRNQQRTRNLAEFALSKDIGVVLINSNAGTRDGDDSFAAMQSYAKAQGYNWYYALDQGTELANAFDARRTPEVFLFDQKGILVYKGAIDDNPGDEGGVQRAHCREAITEMLSGKAVSVTSTRAVGCGIKRKA